MTTFKTIALDYANKVWNKKDMQALDDYLDPSIVIHSTLGDFHGPKAMKDIVDIWLKAFPDLEVHHEIVIGEKDLVSIQWKVQASHQGEFRGKQPTNKSVSYNGVTIYRINNGKIVEYWAYTDIPHLLTQIE